MSFSFVKSTQYHPIVVDYIPIDIPKPIKREISDILYLLQTHKTDNNILIQTAIDYYNRRLTQKHDMKSRIKLISDIRPKQVPFVDIMRTNGFAYMVETLPTCYKQENIKINDNFYTIPTILTRPMIQEYRGHEHKVMAKLPKDLAEFTMIAYQNGDEITELPVFDGHPWVEFEEYEIGEVNDVRYMDEYGIVGNSVINTDAENISKNLKHDLINGVDAGVSIGFFCEFGPKGIWEFDDDWSGKEYNASQINIALTHLAVFSTKDATGRCDLPYCGAGNGISIPF